MCTLRTPYPVCKMSILKSALSRVQTNILAQIAFFLCAEFSVLSWNALRVVLKNLLLFFLPSRL